MDELSKGPNRVKHKEEYEALSCETGRGIFGCEKGTIGSSPKKAEVGIHSVRDPYLLA